MISNTLTCNICCDSDKNIYKCERCTGDACLVCWMSIYKVSNKFSCPACRLELKKLVDVAVPEFEISLSTLKPTPIIECPITKLQFSYDMHNNSFKAILTKPITFGDIINWHSTLPNVKPLVQSLDISNAEEELLYTSNSYDPINYKRPFTNYKLKLWYHQSVMTLLMHEKLQKPYFELSEEGTTVNLLILDKKLISIESTIVNREKRYNCCYCNKTYTYFTTFIKHIEKLHANNESQLMWLLSPHLPPHLDLDEVILE